MSLFERDEEDLLEVIKTVLNDYDKDEPILIASLMLCFYDGIPFNVTFEELVDFAKKIRDKERLKLYQKILQSISFENIDLEVFNILQRYDEDDRKTIINNAFQIYNNDLEHYFESSYKIAQELNQELIIE